MSLIGMLEQINLAKVLQRVEAYTKTGLCVIRQGVQWVELYFGEGRLICIGPIHADTTLGDRLVEAGVISPQVLQAALRFMEAEELSEMRLALTLMDLGYVDRAALRAWAEQQAVSVLRLLFTWSAGDIYFEEHVVPPADRLHVALSITSLLCATEDVPAVSSESHEVANPISNSLDTIQEQQKRLVPARIPDALTLVDVSQFFTEITPALPVVPFAQKVLPSNVELADTVSLAIPASFQRAASSLPQQVQVMSKLIDTSFMQPEMVLVPADLSALCEQNPQIALTPEQWQLLTRADGRTSLQMACQLLGWHPEIVCRIAGELLVEGLLHVVPPTPEYVQELSLTAQTFMNPGLRTDFSGAITNSGTLWSAALPESGPGVLPQYMSVLSDEAQPQWGNQALHLNKCIPAYGDAYAYAGVGSGR